MQVMWPAVVRELIVARIIKDGWTYRRACAAFSNFDDRMPSEKSVHRWVRQFVRKGSVQPKRRRSKFLDRWTSAELADLSKMIDFDAEHGNHQRVADLAYTYFGKNISPGGMTHRLLKRLKKVQPSRRVQCGGRENVALTPVSW